jgi:hypothetical protein
MFHENPWISFVGDVKAGAYAQGGERNCSSSLSSYDTLENFIDKHRAEIKPHAWVVDGRHLTMEQAACTIIDAPIPQVWLTEDEPGDSKMRFVTLDTYIGYLRRGGMKIGRWDGTQVQWESTP